MEQDLLGADDPYAVPVRGQGPCAGAGGDRVGGAEFLEDDPGGGGEAQAGGAGGPGAAVGGAGVEGGDLYAGDVLVHVGGVHVREAFGPVLDAVEEVVDELGGTLQVEAVLEGQQELVQVLPAFGDRAQVGEPVGRFRLPRAAGVRGVGGGVPFRGAVLAQCHQAVGVAVGLDRPGAGGGQAGAGGVLLLELDGACAGVQDAVQVEGADLFAVEVPQPQAFVEAVEVDALDVDGGGQQEGPAHGVGDQSVDHAGGGGDPCRVLARADALRRHAGHLP
ncbi:hypothetical protein OG592_00650 [Streptomyces avidinii]|uniref:hypothetical protein n=1 Tax=Streptomyces avidinii TaxID=1895 RepID=UPI00386AEF47|nr:hypothetical protein OG592_00650 [Streptomyces avidinii]